MFDTIFEVELSIYCCGEGMIHHDILSFSDKKDAIEYAKQWKKERDDDDSFASVYETTRKEIEF